MREIQLAKKFFYTAVKNTAKKIFFFCFYSFFCHPNTQGLNRWKCKSYINLKSELAIQRSSPDARVFVLSN